MRESILEQAILPAFFAIVAWGIGKGLGLSEMGMTGAIAAAGLLGIVIQIYMTKR